MRGGCHSELIAKTLARSWRALPPDLDLREPELTAIAQTLLQTGAGGLAWWRLRTSLLKDSPVGSDFHQAFRLNSLHAARAEKQTAEVFTFLRNNSVAPILVKGIAVARLYADQGLRPSGDIDLCVEPSQHRRADTLLRSEAASHYFVDLHRGFANLDHHSWREIFDRSIRFTVEGVDIRVPCPEDHLRILCFHFLREGAWRPLWLCDVAAAIEARPATFDWDLFLGLDERRAKWFACVILLAHQLIGADLQGVPDAVTTVALPHWLVDGVLKAWQVRAMQNRHQAPLVNAWRAPMFTLRGLRHHWPNPIEGTIGVGGPFNNFPRLPLQVGHCIVRARNHFRRRDTKF